MPRLKLASIERRLFAFLLDVIFAVLTVNSVLQFTRPSKWDLRDSVYDIKNLFLYYSFLIIILLLKDIICGVSPGKFLFGIGIKQISKIECPPAVSVRVLRNLSLFILPIEAVICLRSQLYQKLSDQYLGTLVLQLEPLASLLKRFMLTNFMFFGFFFLAWMTQDIPMKRTDAYNVVNNHLALKHDLILQKIGTLQKIQGEEMSLDLSQKGQGIFEADLLGSSGRAKVQIELVLVSTPERHWQIKQMKLVSR